MAQLDREQLKTVRAIKREGRTIKDPRLRRIFERAAVQTGLVEYNLYNRAGGDQDSSNWRQERESGYGDEWARTGGPLNLNASVRRFKNEFLQHYDPGEKSYQVAAQVQRPREDLRGRYHEEAKRAAGILRQVGGGGPGGSVSAQAPTYRTVPGVDNSATRDQLKQAYFANSHDPDALLELKASLDEAQDVPSRRVRVPGAAPSGGSVVKQTGSAFVQAVREEADHINQAKVPYQWGGGHASKQKRGTKVSPLDCSGAVSRVLGIDPRVSGQFEKWGKPGKGRVTVYANDEHVLMEIDGHFWGTSKSNPGGGPGWIPRRLISKEYLSRFKARHA